MAFTDPQTVTIDSIAHTCNRIRSDGYRSEYSNADESVKLTISHQESKGRTRRMARIDMRVVAADPLSSLNEYKDLGVYIVIDEPEYGFSDADIGNVVAGLTSYLSAATVAALCSNQH